MQGNTQSPLCVNFFPSRFFVPDITLLPLALLFLLSSLPHVLFSLLSVLWLPRAIYPQIEEKEKKCIIQYVERRGGEGGGVESSSDGANRVPKINPPFPLDALAFWRRKGGFLIDQGWLWKGKKNRKWNSEKGVSANWHYPISLAFLPPIFKICCIFKLPRFISPRDIFPP